MIENYKELDARSLAETLSVIAYSDSEVKKSYMPTAETLRKIEQHVTVNMPEYMGNDSLTNVLVAFLKLG